MTRTIITKRYLSHLIFRCLILTGTGIMLTSCTASSGVRITRTADGFCFTIDGQPTYIKGIGGNNRLQTAHEHGANAFRTWGGSVESISKSIAEAQANQMYIMQGIGLTKDSARYHDEAYKDKMRHEVRTLAETFKDDRSIIAWGLGNEIGLGNANIKEAWLFVEELAQIIKSIDKRHLVSTVISHNARSLDFIARCAPSLDFVGINSYGAIGDVQAMVEASAYKGPFMITEWGPTGWWEMPATTWKAPIEQTSEEKRMVYEKRYNSYIFGNPRCLGSFVFLWGQKEERTPTWFSMFIESNVEGAPYRGEMTPMVEAMQRVWSREEPKATAPVLKAFTLNGKTAYESVVVPKGMGLQAMVTAADKEQSELTYVWEILHEATKLGFGGSYEPRPERQGNVVTTDSPTYIFTADAPGNYRLYVYVMDGTGYTATANVPFRVE